MMIIMNDDDEGVQGANNILEKKPFGRQLNEWMNEMNIRTYLRCEKKEKKISDTLEILHCINQYIVMDCFILSWMDDYHHHHHFFHTFSFYLAILEN